MSKKKQEDTAEPEGSMSEKKELAQTNLEGGVLPKVKIFAKPPQIPYRLETEKFYLNTTQEGFENRKHKPADELEQWVARKLKVVKGEDIVIFPGDFDKACELMIKAIQGKIEAPITQVGENDED